MIMIYMQRIERKTKCKKNKIIRRWKERERGGRNRKREIGTWLGECSLSESSNNLGFNNNSRQKLD